jgi:hypothetical protein
MASKTAGEAQPQFWDWANPTMKAVIMIASSPAPGKSIGACRADGVSRGMATLVMTAATAASGTLTKNTDCQPRVAVSTPPMTGPAAPATAAMPPIVPSAAARATRLPLSTH